MSDTRAAIRELRSLSEKRSTQGLTEQERSQIRIGHFIEGLLGKYATKLAAKADLETVRQIITKARQLTPAAQPSAPLAPHANFGGASSASENRSQSRPGHVA